MTIQQLSHARLWEEIFTKVASVRGPVLTFGVQYIELPRYVVGRSASAIARRMITTGDAHRLPVDYTECGDLTELLLGRGADEAVCLDLFDTKAKLRHDMNKPIPEAEHGRYRTLIDIGSLEHIFDTRQCVENCIRLLAVGGWYLLHVPVNGYFGHGIHVFNPLALLSALRLNGCEVRYTAYTTIGGRRIRRPGGNRDQLMWLAAEKVAELDTFTPPQQDGWDGLYEAGDYPHRRKIEKYGAGVT